MESIELTQGQVAIVDDADYEALSRNGWYAMKTHSGHYAARAVWSDGASVTILMHRQVLGPPKGVPIDHIDGDGLNNTRANLRLASITLNNRNNHRRKPTRRGLPVGVKIHRNGKCYAQIKIDSKLVHLGTFDTPAEASSAYQAARKRSIAAAIADIVKP